MRGRILAIVMCLVLPVVGGPPPAVAAPAKPAPPAGDSVPLDRRAAVFGADWSRSTDGFWQLVPSDRGVIVAAASFAAGARWNTVAALAVEGVTSRQWLGRACLLRGSHVLAVAFGPVEAISTPALFERGAYSALVNMDSGQVTGLPVRSTYAYFSPSCGADGRAVFTTYADEESATTVTAVSATAVPRTLLDSAAGETVEATTLDDGALVGVDGASVVRFEGGRRTTVARAAGHVQDLRALAAGAVAYTVDSGDTTTAWLSSGGRETRLAHGPRGAVALDQAAQGPLVVHGEGIHADTGWDRVRVLPVPMAESPSAHGDAFAELRPRSGRTGPVTVHMTAAAGESADVTFDPLGRGRTTRMATLRQAVVAPAATTGQTVDAGFACGVRRNDPAIEVYQPSPQQVEWAVDQAVAGNLTTARPANWHHSGLPAWSPQGMFPLAQIDGGGHVPEQVMLGILANESNLWQASGHVSVGGYGNPLTGNVYGRPADGSLSINWAEADCGYGVAQVTDGMRAGADDPDRQKAIAVDYASNIARGVNILISKWNQLKVAGITANGASPDFLENWYLALWAYNAGMRPDAKNGNTTGCTPSPSCTDTDGNWGLGWSNNPINPIYRANRHMFNSDPADPVHPADWPYQERVIGWAAYPIYEPDGSYAQAWWTSNANRDAAVPSPALFCDSSDDCDPNNGDRCLRGDLHCWLHHPVTWKDCTETECAFRSVTYNSGDPEPAGPATEDPADCTTNGLPAGATIVDDRPSTAQSPYSDCAPLATTGSFAFTFTSDTNGNFPAHIDLHQINGGLNGHYWFTHTAPEDDLLAATGTWTFPASVTGWGRVFIHVPALGAQTAQAHYSVIDGATGSEKQRVVNQGWGANRWVSIGAFQLTPGSKVSLTSYAPHDDAGLDVAWDAVAFVPGPKPVYKVVALGDSYSAGEGLGSYDANTANDNDKCHRSALAYPRLVRLPGQSVTLAQANASGLDELDDIACSFAKTVSIDHGAVNQSPTDENPWGTGWGGDDYTWGEEQQDLQGYLDADTDFVLISVGGNDARFKDVLQYCGNPLTGFHNCSSPGQIMPHDPQELRTYEEHVIGDLLLPKLVTVYTAIHGLAPNAQIYVVGYPQLFSAGPCLTFSTSDAEWLNNEADLMRATQVAAMFTLNHNGIDDIHYADPYESFSGHSVCAPGGDEYLNGLVIGDFEASFHPNAAGQNVYAQVVTNTIAEWN